MPGVLRVLTLILMSVMPGGLLMVTGYVFANMIAEGMRTQQGSQPRRFARAITAIRWRDVMSHTRKLV